MKYSLLVILLAAVMSVGCAGTRGGCKACGQVGGCDVGCDGGCESGMCGPGGQGGMMGAGGCPGGNCGIGNQGGLRAAAMARRSRLADQRGPAAMPGPPAATVTYPYYTTRAPRDFLMDNPPSIGR